MNDALEVVIEDFNKVGQEAQTLTFMSRDIDLQRDAIESVGEFLKRLATEKMGFVERDDEPAANMMLAFEMSLISVRQELEMWVALKEDRPEEAWDHLVSAQQAARAALGVRRQVAPGQSHERLQNIVDKLDALEHLVFPPQVYLSIGGKVQDRVCSICGEDYESCQHVRGRAYAGEFCHTIVRDLSLAEVSFVYEPADKRCRVTHFTDGNQNRNRMTWRLEPRGRNGT